MISLLGNTSSQQLLNTLRVIRKFVCGVLNNTAKNIEQKSQPGGWSSTHVPKSETS
jgi:hypothetical protein